MRLRRQDAEVNIRYSNVAMHTMVPFKRRRPYPTKRECEHGSVGF